MRYPAFPPTWFVKAKPFHGVHNLRDSHGGAGGVVCLGKFDALHLGHRALAERAATLGNVFMLSFSNMAAVLGWEPR